MSEEKPNYVLFLERIREAVRAKGTISAYDFALLCYLSGGPLMINPYSYRHDVYMTADGGVRALCVAAHTRIRYRILSAGSPNYQRGLEVRFDAFRALAEAITKNDPAVAIFRPRIREDAA